MSIHPKKIQNIISLTQQERYDYFLRKTADSMLLWGLFNEGWATANGKIFSVPLWPEECFAQMCATDEWSDLTEKYIEMKTFIESWIPGMEKDNRTFLAFPTLGNKGLSKTPHALLSDLKNEMSQYE